MKILIVDDEKLAIERLKRLLNSLGFYNIHEATTSQEAIDVARLSLFDIAFLDISMPDMDGITLGYLLKTTQKDISIIYQTAHENHALGAFDVGAIDYLLKPYSKEQLQRSINRVKADANATELMLISKAGENSYLLSPTEIYYVKADLAEVILRTKDGFSYYPKKISEMEQILLKHGFLRVHRSYLVNLQLISYMETVEQSRIVFSFYDIKESVESSKDGAKNFRNMFSDSNNSQ